MSQNLNTLIDLYDKQKGKNPDWDRDTLAAIQAGMAQINEGQINKDRGASGGVRAQVGAAQSPEDKLATLRKSYPEAVPTGDDNFLFVNRRNNQPTLYNPPGMDLGDIPEYGREIATTGAGIGAAVLTSPAATTGVGAAAPYVAGGLASAGAGLMYDKGMEYLGDTVDTRTLGEQFEDYSVEAALGMLPVDKLGAPVSNFMRRFVTGPAQEAVREVVEKYGIDATAGTVGNGLLQSLEAGSQKMGAAMDNFQKSADEMYAGIQTMIDDMFEGMGGPQSSIKAGRNAIEKGKGFITTFREEADNMYKLVDKQINSSEVIVPTNLRSTAGGMVGIDELGKLFEPQLARKILGALEEGGPVSYASLAQIRSTLGEQIGARESVGPGNIGLGQAKKLYEAITLDMQELARSQGDEAYAAWTAANEFYRAGSRTIDEVIKPTMTTNSGKEWLPPEEVLNNIASLARKDPDGLARMQTSGVMSETDMGKAGAGILQDLGQPTKGSAAEIAGRQSPSRIPAQTSSKVLNEESKDVLFNMTSRQIFEDLRVLGGALKETDQLVNYSNSGAQNLLTGGLGAAGTAIVGGDAAQMAAVALGTVVLPYLGSKGLQSKPFINWVTKGSKSGTGPEWVRAGARMAAKEGLMDVYDAVIEFESGNTGATEQNRGMLFE